MVSVIVPVHNSAAYLQRCIAALQALDYPRESYEILLVDNNSTDGSRAIMEAASDVRVLAEPRPGSYSARNLGIQHARGSILAFTDSDCYPGPGWLRAAERALANPTTQVVMGQRRPALGTGLLRYITAYETRKDAMVLSSDDPSIYYGYTNNMAVRREVMSKYGPFLERPRGSDTVFVRRVVDGEGCQAVVYEPGMIVEHGELTRISTYYRKMFIYGRSRGKHAHIRSARALTAAERWSTYRAAVRQEGLSRVERLALGAALAVGAAAWHLGVASSGFRQETGA
jgi:glycosyltransferase involved in cell wall biosynthesis